MSEEKKVIAYHGMQYGKAKQQADNLARWMKDEYFKGITNFEIIVVDSESKQLLDSAQGKLVEALDIASDYVAARHGYEHVNEEKLTLERWQSFLKELGNV